VKIADPSSFIYSHRIRAWTIKGCSFGCHGKHPVKIAKIMGFIYFHRMVLSERLVAMTISSCENRLAGYFHSPVKIASGL
jgi:hypothetical protein